MRFVAWPVKPLFSKLNKTGNALMNLTLRCFRVTFVAMEKQ